MRVAYFYLMTNEPDRVRAAAPQHVTYWQGLAPTGYLGGPFTERSGGLITFETDSSEQAERLVADDPFLRNGLVKNHWLKEWIID
jgi:uncharacterized protein YciI